MGKNLIDIDLLEKLQKHFCRANNVYLAAIDRERSVLTAHCGSEEEQKFLNRFIPEDVEESIFRSVGMSQVETIVEIELDVPFIKQCAIINRVNGSICLVWDVVAVIEEMISEDIEVPEYVARTSENQFYRSIAFLEALTNQMFHMRAQEIQTQEVLEQTADAEGQYKKQMRKNEAITSVVQMIESEAAFWQIADNAIREVCEALEIQGGCLVKRSADEKEAEVLAEYSADRNWNFGDKIKGKSIEKLPFFDGKPYMLSSDSMMRKDLENFFIRHHLSAGVFQPIEVDGNAELYICFYEFERERVWDMEDIKFISDVKKILQSICQKRAMHKSYEKAYASLEAELETMLEEKEAAVRTIAEEKLYREKVEQQICIDNLTGLFNRMRCEQDLARLIKEAEETGDEGAFLCLDLDDFQEVNIAWGHQYGDALLKAVAHNLSKVSGLEGHCYRISGDQFAMIVYGDEYKSLSHICKELRTIFERPWFLKNEDYYCKMSMGVVCFPTEGNNVDDLTRKAEIALHTAKKKGKNCIEFYNEKVEETSIYRLDLEQHMRRAVLNSCNEFEVHYQPVMKLAKDGNSCCGAEALVRWHSTELGYIPPNDFLPLAEQLGLINSIGEHVMQEAFKRCKYWNDCGYPDYAIHVNISVIQLLQPDFAAKVKQAITKTKINPKNVVLEVTECLAMKDLKKMIKVLKQIKSLGVRAALDAFGKGNASLNHIKELPIDIVKIDKCIAENLLEDAFSLSFIKTVSELAQTIGIKVCVEGIEQRKQLEALKDIPLAMAEGYYFGRPMQANEFEKILVN